MGPDERLSTARRQAIMLVERALETFAAWRAGRRLAKLSDDEPRLLAALALLASGEHTVDANAVARFVSLAPGWSGSASELVDTCRTLARQPG